MRRHGLTFRALGENIQMNDDPDPAPTAVRSWMGSPGHKELMLSPNFTETGVGVATSEEGAVYFTQLFLQP